MKGRTKIGMTPALVVALDLTVFASTGERRVGQLSRLLQACVVFGTAPKPRPESSLALRAALVDLRPLSPSDPPR